MLTAVWQIVVGIKLYKLGGRDEGLSKKQ
jgi:hypothetical protein